MMKTRARERSLAGGLSESRLPEFTPEEIQRIKGTHDYFGLNHYTSVLLHSLISDEIHREVAVISDRAWIESGSPWLRITPFGFRKLLKFIKDNYGNPPIYVTENGVSERGEVDLNDAHRSYYYENYINQALKARLVDGADVRGYTAWSLMDNFEWLAGYSERFGLFYVNFSDTNLPRIPKASASRYATIIKCNGFPDPASGPHECLKPDGKIPSTAAPGTTTPVDFLGLALLAEDAEVALYVLFAFVLVGAVSIIFAVYMLMKTTKQVKKQTKHDGKSEGRRSSSLIAPHTRE
uniref:Lactase n=1 Tax=Salarias fasciatus TaxID=181472 RepID=A0A672IEQ1_SALFA